MSKTLRKNIDTGIKEISKKDTWRRACGLLCGSLLGSVAVMVSDKLTNSSNKFLRYGAGTIASGTVAVLALGMKYENVGLGSVIVCAGQAINTATSLVFNKNTAELLSN